MKKLAIVCGSPSSEMLAPFDNDEYDIWALGNRIKRYPRVTLAFEVHDSLGHYPEGYAEQLVSMGIPLIVGQNFPIGGDRILPFPIDAAANMFGRKYFTSTCAYMMALSIMEDYDLIEVYGVDMAVDDAEYFGQRPCMEYWIGVAEGRGIKVVLPDVCPVAKSNYLYGAEPRQSLGVYSESELLKLADMHRNSLEQVRAQIRALEVRVTAHDAAAQVYERLAKVSRGIEAGQAINSLTDTVAIR